MKVNDIKKLQEEHETLFLKEKLSPDERFRLAWLNETLERYQAQAQYVRQYLGARFSNRTFETFKDDENKEAKEKCLKYRNTYKDKDKNGLLIVGSYGTGKTHLAAAIANDLIDEGIPIMFDTFGGYLQKLKNEFDSKKKYCLENMKKIPVLFIDDIGKEKQTDWTESVLFDVINSRYEDMLPVVITSNYIGKELEELLGSATYSRLFEMCTCVMMKGKDYRKKGSDI